MLQSAVIIAETALQIFYRPVEERKESKSRKKSEQVDKEDCFEPENGSGPRYIDSVIVRLAGELVMPNP